MEFSVPGFIKQFCSPNAILTLTEYLIDYAPEDTKAKGMKVIEKNLEVQDPKIKKRLIEKIECIKQGERDIYF